MISASFQIAGQHYTADLNRPLDISIAIHPGGPRAWYVDPVKIEPVRTERFTGSVAEGGAVNFRNIAFNPHGHGTHTETSGHIDREISSINQVLRNHFFTARLITAMPEIYAGPETSEIKKGDRVITPRQLGHAADYKDIQAAVIRSLPNGIDKKTRDYSNTNPTFFSPEALTFLRKAGIVHLLTDLPSVDREEDGGALLAHRAFWRSGLPGDSAATITEFIYVPDSVPDGCYLLNLQTAAFENDACPCRPVLFAAREVPAP